MGREVIQNRVNACGVAYRTVEELIKREMGRSEMGSKGSNKRPESDRRWQTYTNGRF